MQSRIWRPILVASVLIAIGTAEAQTPPTDPVTGWVPGWVPRRHACLESTELERIKVDPQGRSLSFPQPQLGLDYYEVIGWLEGFFNGWR